MTRIDYHGQIFLICWGQSVRSMFLGAHAPLEIARVSESVTKKFETTPEA